MKFSLLADKGRLTCSVDGKDAQLSWVGSCSPIGRLAHHCAITGRHSLKCSHASTHTRKFMLLNDVRKDLFGAKTPVTPSTLKPK